MWFKVDDKLHDHRKARAAGKSAMGVWLLAGSWCADNLTDGFVPASILPRWGRTKDAEKLVEVGLWHTGTQDGENGWRFHEWLERQPSRADKIAERKVRAEAGRIGGLASGQTRKGQAKPKQGAKQSASHVASGVLEPPSRPVPSRPSASKEADKTLDDFDRFWAAYPRKIGKGHAVKAWDKALGLTSAGVLIEAAEDFAAWCQAEEKDDHFIPHPTTWLNGQRWEDERPARAQPQTNIGAHLALVEKLAAKEAQDNQPRQIGPA